MSSLKPEEAKFLAESFLPTVQNEFQITQKVLSAVPEDQAHYKPDEFSMTAFELSWHMASAEAMFLGAVADGKFTFSGGPQKPSSMSEVVKIHADEFSKNMAALKSKSGEELAEILDFRGVFQLPAVMYLMFNNNHIIHHRGQLSTYLRPMGAKVPAIYGESYDSKEAKKAAQPA